MVELRSMIETIIRNRTSIIGKKYYGGAVERIMAQIPKGLTEKEKLIDELEMAFKREENCYF